MPIRWVPRWRHKRFELAALQRLRLDPNVFVNDTDYDWHLKFMSYCGDGLTRRTLFEIGMTQKGDINYNQIQVARLFAGHHKVTCGNAIHQFDPPYILGPQDGISVELFFNGTENPLISDEGTLDYPAVCFIGWEFDEDGIKRPKHLTAMAEIDLEHNESLTFESVNLFNDGDRNFYIDHVVLPMDYPGNSGGERYAKFSYLINPNTGIKFMPDSKPIPVGCIAPMCRTYSDLENEHPFVYHFPQNAVLKPRQRLNIEIESTYQYGAINPNYICLYGVLEVR